MTEQADLTTLPADSLSASTENGVKLALSLVYPTAETKVDVTLSRYKALLVGRNAGTADLQLRDLKMSRSHFRTFWDGQAQSYRIQDMQSRNGTFVDGRPLTTAPLEAGAIIRAGDSIFVCHDVAEEVDPRHRENVARSGIPILLRGETGTGKERLAEQLHALSGRDPFVAVNCGEIASDLVASELFGHVRGAFSGAHSQRSGHFAIASGGTLFLDEIGELAIDLQPALLRVLERGTIRPVGGERETRVDVRIISATNVELEQAMRDGRFRRDLYARLAGHTIEATPLRHRKESILEIARDIAAEDGHSSKMSADAAEALLLWDWPYNVRELKSLLRNHWAMAPIEPLSLDAIRRAQPAVVRHLEQARNPSPATNMDDEHELSTLLRSYGGNVSAVAKHTGRSRGSIYRWMERAGIRPTR